jgi:DNA-binding transcriptional LysR family regulator
MRKKMWSLPRRTRDQADATVLKLTDIDLKLLKAFIAVVDNRGLAAAQANLGLGLSTISTHLTSLERRLGLRLCERGRRGFRLTPDGQKAYDVARSLVGAIDEAGSKFASLRNALEGSLRIGIVDNIVNNPHARLHAAIHRFDARSSEVGVAVEVISPRDLERHVSDGLIDIGIGPAINRTGDLQYISLFEERQYLYCGDLHPLFAYPAWTMQNVLAQRVARHVCPLPEHLATRGLLQSASAAHNMESVALLVLSGCYIGFLPEHFAQGWVEAGRMRAVLPDDLHYVNVFTCMTRKRNTPSRIEKQFLVDLIEAHRARGADRPAATGSRPSARRSSQSGRARSPDGSPRARRSRRARAPGG